MNFMIISFLGFNAINLVQKSLGKLLFLYVTTHKTIGLKSMMCKSRNKEQVQCYS